MNKRQITNQEEQLLRLHHHDFRGCSIKTTALKMGITIKDVRTLLKRIKRKAPQLFPILNQRRQIILARYEEGADREAIKNSLGISEKVLQAEVTYLYKHNFLSKRPLIEQYNSAKHDHLIREKF